MNKQIITFDEWGAWEVNGLSMWRIACPSMLEKRDKTQNWFVIQNGIILDSSKDRQDINDETL